jgi:hypothetical protein
MNYDSIFYDFFHTFRSHFYRIVKTLETRVKKMGNFGFQLILFTRKERAYIHT